MRQILFVDDEPRILTGLERALRSQRSKWDMRFASSGAEALSKLSERPADVIVTDFRMPGMDGAELLQQVRMNFPGTVRFILSGQFDNEAGMRALPVAHQFLNKPCEPATIIVTVERACRLGDLMSSDVVKNVSSALGLLPPNPEVYLRLSQAITNEHVNLETIANLIEQDVALTMKVLQLANSAFFSIPQKVESIHEAIRSLGFDLLRQMVLVAEVFEKPVARPTPKGFSRSCVQKHSLLCAQIARCVLASPTLVYSASVAALLHDTGRIVLAQEMPRQYEAVLETCEAHSMPLSQTEQTILSTTHEEVGAYIACIWGFPDAEVYAILGHHKESDWETRTAIPGAVDSNGKVYDLGLIVALADHFAGEPNPQLRTPALNAHWDAWAAQSNEIVKAAER